MAAAVPVEEVIIVGAGQSGLATSACLSLRGVRNLVLERDDCIGSLWRKRAYDRLTLHIPKSASALPLPDAAPTYLPRDHFARYLDACPHAAPARGPGGEIRRGEPAVAAGGG